MGQKHSEMERRILVIVNHTMQSTRDFIEKLLCCHPQYPNIIFYSLNKYEEIKTRLITDQDKEVLNTMHLVFVIGESRDLLKAFSLFSNVDSPPVFGIGNTQDFSSPMLFHYSFHHAELISRLVFS